MSTAGALYIILFLQQWIQVQYHWRHRLPLNNSGRILLQHHLTGDNGSSFIAMEFSIVLKQNNLTQKLIRPHTPEQNGIIERANKTMRESMVSIIPTDYDKARHEISKIVNNYNNKRSHSTLHYITPIQYYRGNPEELLKIMDSKIYKARILRREINMKEQKRGETAGTVS